jgi:hypothetical protein
MYGLCRKYQDDASALISACDQSPTGLTSKLKSLVDNQNAVNDAQAAIQNKVKNGIPNIKQQQPAQETSCQLAIRLIEQMIDTLKQLMRPLKLFAMQLIFQVYRCWMLISVILKVQFLKN